MSFSEYAYSETRYRALKRLSMEHATELMERAQAATEYRAELYQKMAKMEFEDDNEEGEKAKD